MAALGTRLLKLEIDGDEVTAQVSRVAISTGDADQDTITFADAAAGGARQYTLALTAVQDTAPSGTVWNKVWSAAGTDVDVVVMPHGNTTPSAQQPHFEGTVTIKEPDGDILGGEADASNTAKFTFEVEWPFTSKPVKVTS